MSGLFGGGGGNSVQQQVYAGMQVSTSLYSGCIPYIAGRQRVSANLLWYGNFQVNTSTSGGGKGGGGSGTKQYSYSSAWIGGLCVGPIQGVTRVWHDKALVNLTFENLALSEGGASFVGSISGTSLTITKFLGGFISIGAVLTGAGATAGTTITGGSGLSWTVSPSQTVASTQMLVSQPVWSGFPSGTPAGQKISYGPIAYVATSAYNLGSSASMPNLTYEVEGCVPGYSDANSIYDADPSAVLLDYLLDPVHGALANYPGIPLTIGSSAAPLQGTTNSYQAYVMSAGNPPLLTSPYEDTQRQATDFVAELLQCTNSTCRLSVGTLEILPYCDQFVSGTVAGTSFSYTPNLTPVYSFTDDDYCPSKDEDPVQLTIKPQSDTYNTVSVEYNDRSNYYNQAPVTISDLNDIALFGPRVGSQLSWHQITQAPVALMAGQLWLNRQLKEVNSYDSRVRLDYSLLEPGDYIAHNDAALGLAGQVCQITQIEDDADNTLMLTALELPGVTRTLAQYDWSGAAGYFANYASDPGAVQAPAIFVMPPMPGSLSEGITIGIAVCGQTSNAFWLGCDVYCSVDGGTTYQNVGRVPAACRYGTLTANIGAVADPDISSTLSVALANTNLQISTSVTHAEADSNQTPILVDSGTQAEIMSFGAASLVSGGNYNLSYLRRGLYGSTDQAHTSGDLFVRLDGDIFQIAMDPGYAGQTISFKFVSYNTWMQNGPQTLAGATAYSYTIPNAVAIYGAAKLLPRGLCSYDGQRIYKATSASSAWDSDCVTANAYQSISFSAKIGQVGEMALGLVSSTGSTLNPETNMNYCWYIHPDSAAPLDTETPVDLLTESSVTLTTEFGGLSGIFESGVQKYVTSTPPAPGDEFLIVYDRFTVRYYLNSVLIRSVPTSGASLYLAIAEYSPGALFGNVQVDVNTSASPTEFHAFGGANVNNTNAMKLSGTNNTWDGSIVCSIVGYESCHILAKPNDITSNNFALGLATSDHAAAAATYSGTNSISLIDYAWKCSVAPSGANQWQIVEFGLTISTFSAPAVTDTAAVTCDGVNVYYFLDDPSTPVRTTPVTGFPTLYGMACFYEIDSGVNSLSFGPTNNLAVQDTSQINENAASQMVSVYAAGVFPLTHGIAWTPSSPATNVDIGIDVTLTTSGFPVAVDLTMGNLSFYTLAGTTAWQLTVSVFRDGVSIATAPANILGSSFGTPWTASPNVQYVPMAFTFVDPSASAGSHTYSVVMSGNSTGGNGSASAFDTTLKVREIKR